MKAITASYQWTEDAMVTAQLHHLQGTKKRLRWLRIVALGGMIAVATWLVMREFLLNWTILGLVAVAYIAVIISEVTRHPKWVERASRQLFKRMPDNRKTLECLINNSGVYFMTDSMEDGVDTDVKTIEWEDVHHIAETEDGFLVYENKRVFYWIPAEAFKPKSDMVRFRKLIKDKKIKG